MTVTVTITLTKALKTRLEELAALGEVSLSELLVSAALDMARRDAEWIALVQEGLDEARRGELHDHEDVMADLEAHIAASKVRKAG